MSLQLKPSLPHCSWKDIRRRRIQPHRFLHARHVVRQMLLHLIILRHPSDLALLGRSVYLLHELRVDRAIRHDMIDHALESGARCICTGEKHEQNFGFDVVV